MEGEDEEEMKDLIEVTDDAISTFKGHSGSVFCVDINPMDQSMAVSGKMTIAFNEF